MEAIKSSEVDLEAGFDEVSDAAAPTGVVCAGDFIEADVEDGFLRCCNKPVCAFRAMLHASLWH